MLLCWRGCWCGGILGSFVIGIAPATVKSGSHVVGKALAGTTILTMI